MPKLPTKQDVLKAIHESGVHQNNPQMIVNHYKAGELVETPSNYAMGFARKLFQIFASKANPADSEPAPSPSEQTTLKWFSQEPYVPNHELAIEQKWREQGGVDPDTNEMWLTPRMHRNAIRLEAALKLEQHGIREVV
jgi:hypothetical protein